MIAMNAHVHNFLRDKRLISQHATFSSPSQIIQQSRTSQTQAKMATKELTLTVKPRGMLYHSRNESMAKY